jgi:hypothetical protein
MTFPERHTTRERPHQAGIDEHGQTIREREQAMAAWRSPETPKKNLAICSSISAHSISPFDSAPFSHGP